MGEKQETNPSQEQPTLPRQYGDLVGSDSAKKTIWHDLVGLTVEEAERKIKEEMPGAEIQVVQPDCFVTMDFKRNRIRLFLDSSGLIARAPRIG
ncbi:hypothetical protein JCGZ_09112 [Jatropha curcas]|uniref:Uncharacterized protein n=1 Tax=Jatropha curcas TaxID=180498 RepID=A0A067KV14_JATCU|nr:hypothetical protein JCGZ_09112 [Jatropha curcas]